MSADRWIVIPRWDEFQHRDIARGNTEPKWIKTFTRLLHDDDYLNLSLSQRGVLHGLWILYASSRRVVSESHARRTLVASTADAKHWRGAMEALNHAGFIEFSAGKPLATCQQVASTVAGLDLEVERARSKSKVQVKTLRGVARDPDDGVPLGATNGHAAYTLTEHLAAGLGLDFHK